MLYELECIRAGSPFVCVCEVGLRSLSMTLKAVAWVWWGTQGQLNAVLFSGQQTKVLLGTFCLSASRHRKTIDVNPDEVFVIKQSELWNCWQLPSNVKTSHT